MAYRVLKFGGSSQCKEGLNVILKKIKEYTEENYKLIFVISAVGKTTNNLYEITKGDKTKYNIIYVEHEKLCKDIGIDFAKTQLILDKLNEDIDKYLYDEFTDQTQQKIKIISYGEILSSHIVNDFLRLNSIDSHILNAHLFIKNRSSSEKIDSFTLNIDDEFYCDETMLLNLIKNKQICVTQGFISLTNDNKYCILTRSGSNTTASLIANAVRANRLEIWTDVNGLYTADPRKIKNARIIPYITYALCQEASVMGSHIIHPYSIKPCEELGIPIHIKNTFNDSGDSTVINCCNGKVIDDVHIISYKGNITLFRIESKNMFGRYGFASEIFNIFGENKIDIDIISTSNMEISTTTSEINITKLEKAKELLIERGFNVTMILKCANISIIGNNILNNTLCRSIKIDDIYLMQIGSNNLSISYVISENDAGLVMQQLHDSIIIKV